MSQPDEVHDPCDRLYWLPLLLLVCDSWTFEFEAPAL